MAASKSDVVLVATRSFIGALDDGTEFTALDAITKVTADHPAAKKWPECFEPLDYEAGVERATAAPGEKRGA